MLKLDLLLTQNKLQVHIKNYWSTLCEIFAKTVAFYVFKRAFGRQIWAK